MLVPGEGTHTKRICSPASGPLSPDPTITLNRHDHPARTPGTRVAKDTIFRSFKRRTWKRTHGAVKRFVRLPPMSYFGLGVLGAFAVGNFGLGLMQTPESL